MKEPNGKMKDAFGFSGSITEQEISFVRTVYSYVCQKKTLIRFSLSLETFMELGIMNCQTKGVIT